MRSYALYRVPVLVSYAVITSALCFNKPVIDLMLVPIFSLLDSQFHLHMKLSQICACTYFYDAT